MIVIFDADGTLTDATAREHLVPVGDAKYHTDNWIAYNGSSGNDPLVVPIAAMLRALATYRPMSAPHKIYLVTGRGESARRVTEDYFIRQRLLHMFDDVIMRPMDDHRSSAEFKRDVFRKLKPDLVIDDHPDVAEMCRQEKIVCMLEDSKDPAVYLDFPKG